MTSNPTTSRREFVKLASAVGAASVLAGACEPSDVPASVVEEPPAFFKDTSPFIRHGTTNLESRIEDLGGFITPNRLFFVRNNSNSIQVNAEDYRLEVEGDSVTRPLSLSLTDLINMPARSVYSYLECGGNQRLFFASAMGQPARGTQWGRGGVGMAEWTGVSLADVLERAGITEKAINAQLIGLDVDSPEGGFRRPIPIEKALDPDTILAYRMNGEWLPKDHGYPVRAIVPGWVGSTSVKWLGRIEVSENQFWSRNNTTSYVLIGDDYPPEGEAQGRVATLQSIKSVILLPWPAQLPAGEHLIRGYAYSPHASVTRLEWRLDNGSWQDARFIDPPIKYAWRRFEFRLDVGSGSHSVATRATDEAGNSQPESVPFNEKGYLYNAVLTHPVMVG